MLIGSVFAPLFGVVLVDHFLIRRRRLPAQVAGLHWQALLAWAVGAAAYHLIAAQAPDFGATLPALLLAGVLHALLSLSRGRETAQA
ncbi:hypothetical protein D3C80_1854120 [compost metagenome]